MMISAPAGISVDQIIEKINQLIKDHPHVLVFEDSIDALKFITKYENNFKMIKLEEKVCFQDLNEYNAAKFLI